MVINRLYIALLFCLTCLLSNAQVKSPGASQTGSILITGAVIHQGNGDEIQDGAVGFKEGKIDYVGSAANAKPLAYDEIVDSKGQHLYPGFIAVNSTLGLQEIGAVRATRDQREVGSMNPHIRALIAFNTDSRVTPTVRSNGVLLGQITPRGGRISGSSSVMHFDGWNWEDAVIKADEGIHLNWPRIERWDWSSRKMKANENYDKQVEELKDFLRTSKAYCLGDHDKTDLRKEASCGLFDKTKTLYVHSDRAMEMESAMNMCRDLGIAKLCIVGAYDAPLIIEKLKENNVSVLLRRVHEMPKREDDDIDLPFKLPALLEEAGVVFALDNSGDMEQMGTRNLPFYVGTSIAYGLDKKKAVKTITLNAAKILGIDDRLGSIEVGKDATLFISAGDAFDMRSNEVTRAYIDGRLVDLENHQEVNYKKYKEKYEAEER